MQKKTKKDVVVHVRIPKDLLDEIKRYVPGANNPTIIRMSLHFYLEKLKKEES